MEKINIAELLKDCPKGIKLYSPIFGEVFLDKIKPHLSIVVITDKEQGDFKEEFLYDGRYGSNGECMLFPSKDQRDWTKFQIPFKDGDILADKTLDDMEDFVNFEVAKKLKEKGFSCKYPFAMYDEDGDFYPLFTSCDEDEDSKCIFGNRMYYDYDDFLKDEDARIAPTISQVLKWLREEKDIDLVINPVFFYDDVLGKMREYGCKVFAPLLNKPERCGYHEEWEQAALAGIEYVLDNLI